jgi:hypothetical protein
MCVARNNHHLLHAMRFLTGLNDSFNVVKSQILLLDPLPSMTKIFSMVLQFERQNCPITLHDSKVMINTSEVNITLVDLVLVLLIPNATALIVIGIIILLKTVSRRMEFFLT